MAHKILAVDNEEDILALIFEYLNEDEKYELFQARDLTEARVVLQEQQVSLILLDVILDRESGFDFLHELKSSKATHEIPVVVISVIDNPARSHALGAAGYLAKPFSAEKLKSKLEELLS